MDVDEDNLRHKREEEDRQRKRRERRKKKSDAQIEREARRREHNQRVIAEQNKKHKSDKTKSLKPPPPPAVEKSGSKFQALFSKRSEGFLIDLNFRNAAPRPPVGPCFVGSGLDGELNDKWTKYKANNAVESNYSWKLHAEPDLGVPLAPSAMDLEGCYVDPSKARKKQKLDAYDELFDEDEMDEKKENKVPAPLHPDDDILINWKGYKGDSVADELQMKRDSARAVARNSGKRMASSGPQEHISISKRKNGSRVLKETIPSFMKLTTYMSNDLTQSEHQFKSLAQTKAQTKVDIEQKLAENTLTGKEAIQKSFDLAAVSGALRSHPSKKNVQAVCEIPLLPDNITWGHTLTHVVLDNLPKIDPKHSVTAKQIESAYIGDVIKGTKDLRMECNLLVPECSQDEGLPSSKSIYSAIQKYDLDVFPLKEENAPHVNFLLAVDDNMNVATYHPISSRVQLSTGRPAHLAGTSRLITKREMDADEIVALEKTLAEIDSDLAKKHGIEYDGHVGTNNAAKRQNPFAAGDNDNSDFEDD